MSPKRTILAALLFGLILLPSKLVASRWETIPSIGAPTARHEAAFVGFEDKLYLIGGRRINPVDVFDPATNRWTAKSPTPVELHHFQAVVVGEHIYLMGAMTGPYPKEKPLEKVVAYHPRTDSFEMLHTIPSSRRRGGAGAVVYKNKIYLVGGITNGHVDGFQPWFDEYDPKTGGWKQLPDAPHARDHFQAVVIGDRLYAAAGRTTSQATKEVFNLTVDEIDVYDFKKGKWLAPGEKLKIPTPRAGNMAIPVDGKLVIGGGESGQQRTAHAEVEVFDPETNKWSNWPQLNRGRHGSGFVQLGKYVYTASGCGNRGGNPELDSVERIAVANAADAMQPIASKDLVFAEKDGLVAVEAEHFFEQSETDTRAFYLTTSESSPDLKPDGDPSHVAGASGGAYLEILPDTRRTHGDKLIRGTNFSPQPGKMAVLSYKVNIKTPGRYYVWVRAHSTGSEDNGLHVGIDGTWPETGQRLQWCEGKRTWRWESKQRTEAKHCGEAHKIYLDIDKAGEHTIHFSMREDGFEFDKWFMTTDRNFARPDGVGPKSLVQAGTAPKAYRFVAEPKQEALLKAKRAAKSLVMPAAMFADAEKPGYYLDQGKWLAVNPERNKEGKVGRTFPFPTGVYNLTLRTVGENDGQSTYQVKVDDEAVGDFKAPLSTKMFEEGSTFNNTWKNIKITEGAIIHVASQIGSKDGEEYSRARWAAVEFEPADEATKKVAAPLLAQLSTPTLATKPNRDTSPTKPVSSKPLIEPRQAHGDGNIEVSGERKQWHKVTLTLNGPYAHEQDNAPNPFTDYRMTVTFTHEGGSKYIVPGYFAADGDAKNTSAKSGTKWRAHFAADKTGSWTYAVAFHQGKNAALNADASAEAIKPFDGKTGTLSIAATDKSVPDLRARGRLQYVRERYLKFAGSGEYFLKVGADAPETLLAFADFDDTVTNKPKKAPVKKWAPHVQDWKSGDPTWKNGKGKGLIGAINYLSGKGCNAFSFLTYNAGGDGDNVWPFIQRDDKLHYDCSKLDQWATVFEHGTNKGMYLHFKMQETENDDHVQGSKGNSGFVRECLDGGNLGLQRKLYCRELIARFGHNLALNWNLGEENTQTNAQQQAMIDYIAAFDPYGHNIVIHTYPGQQDKVYKPLLGSKSKLTGVSLQNSSLKTTHEQTVKWVEASIEAGKPWVVAFDESGSAAHAQCPDLGYRGFDGHDKNGKMVYTQHEVRQQTLWGQLMGGGAGCEYYFGYQFEENDIVCEDWRSRDQSWDYCRIAIQFFHQNKIPFWEMTCMDELVGNPDHGISKYCFAKQSEVYLVYLPNGGTTELDLSKADGRFSVHWFNPREGGGLKRGSVASVTGGDKVNLGTPPADESEDWLVVVRAQ